MVWLNIRAPLTFKTYDNMHRANHNVTILPSIRQEIFRHDETYDRMVIKTDVYS